MRLRRLALAAMGSLLVAAAGHAEIFRCVDADGRTFFTSDRTACEQAEPHVLKRKLQSVVEERATPGARSRPAASGPRPGAGGDGLEQMWRRKRPAAERQLREVEARLGNMSKVVRSCNRGGEWYRTTESGIREHVSCEEIRDEQAKLQQRRDELATYLEDGLEDECRRAGCQPGWVR